MRDLLPYTVYHRLCGLRSQARFPSKRKARNARNAIGRIACVAFGWKPGFSSPLSKLIMTPQHLSVLSTLSSLLGVMRPASCGHAMSVRRSCQSKRLRTAWQNLTCPRCLPSQQPSVIVRLPYCNYRASACAQ